MSGRPASNQTSLGLFVAPYAIRTDRFFARSGDDVVIGGDVHLSGHTVEAGVVKTSTVKLGNGATIGLGTVVDINVDVGDRCEVAARSLIPKHARLEAGAVYAGTPVHCIDGKDRKHSA